MRRSEHLKIPPIHAATPFIRDDYIYMEGAAGGALEQVSAVYKKIALPFC
jgi:hypothetical protein